MAATLLAPAAAVAGSGGAGVTQPAPPKKGTSRPAPPVRPGPRARIAEVRCASNPGGACVDVHRVERSGTVVLRGRNLAGVRQVVFYGARGTSDDALAPVQSATAKRVLTPVPPQAVSGPVAVIDAGGRRSKRWSGLIVDTPQAFSFRPASLMPSVSVALSNPRTIFVGGMQRAVFSFQVTGGRAVDLEVDLIRLKDGALVASWQRPGSAPGATQRIAWNGAVRRKPQAPGPYAFRVNVPGAAGATGSRVQTSAADSEDAVNLVGNAFPIAGPHQFSTSAGRFGAGRRGHTHQGQDVFAKCGTPLVAARGGKVGYAGYHALAGYYVVIDGMGTGVDYMYAHLREPALVSTGNTVYTGQQIGEVGDTGDAVGCHLHFEEWSAPGWYKGGRPYDPLPDLKRWDVR